MTALDELLTNGFVRFPDILPSDLLTRLRQVTDDLLKEQDEAVRAAVRSQGSMIGTMAHPLFAELIALPAALDTLKQMGFSDPTFSDGYIISKPAHSPRLFWHYDWFAWDDPRSYEPLPPQLFFMYYLTDTTRENGCLRAIPGSHLHHNALHDLLGEPHSRNLGQAVDTTSPEFSDRPDEVDVPVKAGDLLIGDARLLHAAHANETNAHRTLITLWYQPELETLPEPMQAQMAKKTRSIPADWTAEARSLLSPMLASSRYNGDAQPQVRTLYRPREAKTAQ